MTKNLYFDSSHLSQIWSNHFSLINHWFISNTYCASDCGLYDGHSSVLHGSIGIISTTFKSESNRIHANGINVFFIQNEWIQTLSNTNNIQLLLGIDSLYISHNWREASVSAISILKQLLLQQIFCGFVFQVLFRNMKKDVIKISILTIIQMIFFADFFIFFINQ